MNLFLRHPAFVETSPPGQRWSTAATESLWRASRWGFLRICPAFWQHSPRSGWHRGMFPSASQLDCWDAKRTVSSLHSSTFTLHSRRPQCQVSFYSRTITTFQLFRIERNSNMLFPLTRVSYYKLIEECIAQVVLHKSGCDPDFSATKRFQIDVEPLIETLSGKQNNSEKHEIAMIWYN